LLILLFVLRFLLGRFADIFGEVRSGEVRVNQTSIFSIVSLINFNF
jgi:hypothetical protein